jgi:hypothetical protein
MPETETAQASYKLKHEVNQEYGDHCPDENIDRLHYDAAANAQLTKNERQQQPDKRDDRDDDNQPYEQIF